MAFGIGDIISGVVSVFGTVLGGRGDDSGRDEERRSSKREDSLGFAKKLQYKKIVAMADKAAPVDLKQTRAKSQKTVSAMDYVQPLIKRGMVTSEKLKQMEKRYQMDNYAFLQKYPSSQQFSALQNMADKFIISENTDTG